MWGWTGEELLLLSADAEATGAHPLCTKDGSFSSEPKHTLLFLLSYHGVNEHIYLAVEH